MKVDVRGWAQWDYKFSSDNHTWERSPVKASDVSFMKGLETVNKVSESYYRTHSDKKNKI